MTHTLLESVRRSLTRAREPVTDASVVEAVKGTSHTPLAGDAVLRLADRVSRDLTGAGRLQPLLDDPQITDVMVNGPAEVWIDRGDGLRRAETSFADAAEVRSLASRLASACGRRLDDSNPCVDARLPDGTRLHAVLPPVAVDGPFLSLRTHRTRRFDLDSLREAGTLTADSARLVAEIVAAKQTFLVTGGTGSGKTTLLSAVLGHADPGERIVVVEDAPELTVNHPHVLGLQARRPNVEGAGEVDLRELVRQALRMRPDRIVVGECRGPEVVELLAALNTGHDGSAGTLHANASADVPARLAALALPHGLSPEGLSALVAAALRVVVHMKRVGAARIVSEISLLEADPRRAGLSTTPAWRRTDGRGAGWDALQDLLRGRGEAAT
ncbi:MAG: TadA family conjugal transfer-associated ATPase [Stackebrandtia sp.]